jgi:hypothetical protein
VLQHAVIAGTGRAGTSFLVRFLSACGVDAGDLNELGFFEEAHAGYERSIFGDDVPYLVKHPWMFEYLDKVDEADIEIDALIVPVRDIRDAAASRVLQERTWLAEHFPDWPMRTTGGGVPGGSLYSLSIDDQAKVLALGQARLLAWAAERGTPVYLIAFPRLVDDVDYLYRSLSPWITKFVDKDRAKRIHEDMARPSLVHRSTDHELSSLSTDDLRIERDAMARALTKTREAEREMRSRVAQLELELQHRDTRLVELGTRVEELESRLASEARVFQESQVAVGEERLRLESQLLEARSLVEAVSLRNKKMAERLVVREAKVRDLSERVKVLEVSTSYRIGLLATAPVRRIKRTVRRSGHTPSE